jgi:glycosyltransferase involved in cell wall biosynthesis
MMTKTLCQITYNEAEHLKFWVDNHKALYDKVVILDTGSFDDTVKIAKDLGITVFNHAWKHDYSEAMNALIEKVDTEWVVMMSPDSYFTKEDQRKILNLMQDYNILAFRAKCHYTNWLDVNDTNFSLTPHHGMIFKKGMVKLSHRVHEHRLWQQGYKLLNSDIVYHHDSTQKQGENWYKLAYYELLKEYDGQKEIKELALADFLRKKAYKFEKINIL